MILFLKKRLKELEEERLQEEQHQKMERVVRGWRLKRGRHRRRSDPDHPAHGSKGECAVVPGDPTGQVHRVPSSGKGQRDHSDDVEDRPDL